MAECRQLDAQLMGKEATHCVAGRATTAKTGSVGDRLYILLALGSCVVPKPS